MKKLLYLPLIPCLPLILTSCEVHFLGQSFDVPWYAIAVPTAVFSLIVFLIAHLLIIRKTYRCPACGTEFQPNRTEISVWLHQNGERVMRCPICGRKGFCPQKDD